MPISINEVLVTEAPTPPELPTAAPPAPVADRTSATRDWNRAVAVRTDRLRAD
jgi:hypothetical protein